MARGGYGGSKRGKRAAAAGSNSNPDLKLLYEPQEPYPPLHRPAVAPSLTPKEKAQIAYFREFRARCREGPYFTELRSNAKVSKPTDGQKSSARSFDGFEGLKTYTNKYRRKARATPRVDTRPHYKYLITVEGGKQCALAEELVNENWKGEEQQASEINGHGQTNGEMPRKSNWEQGDHIPVERVTFAANELDPEGGTIVGVTPLFPEYIWDAIAPKQPTQNGVNGEHNTTTDARRLKRRALDVLDPVEDGRDNEVELSKAKNVEGEEEDPDEDPLLEEEEQDDDFEEQEDEDGGDDYNAEQYFDNGEGDDFDAGGEDGGYDYD